MTEFTPRAAVIFSDRSCSEMLISELLLVGFDITDEEKNADLLLAEAELLPFIPSGKRRIVFGDKNSEKTDVDNACAVFDYNFSLSTLNVTLKNIFFQILFEKKESCDISKSALEASYAVEITALPDRKNALVGSERIPLSTAEWKLLDMLCRAAEKGESVSRSELGTAIGHDELDGGNIVDVYICRLRKKLEIPLGRRLIYTVRGLGYSILKTNTEGAK